MTIPNEALRKLAESATKGPWMRLFGERTVYDRMEDGCRGNAIVRADLGYSPVDGQNLDFIAAANPAKVIELLDRIDRLEAENEAKNRLLVQVKNRALAIIEAPKNTYSDGKAVREMLREATHIKSAIAQHLKGTP